jgi:hypothetical protein
MATTTRVKQWTFGTADDYVLAGDAAITASVLSMTAPKLELPWATHWDTEPGYDGNGDAVLAQNVSYKAHTGGADITMLDGELHMQAKLSALLSTPGWHTTVRGGATNPILAQMNNSGAILEASGIDYDYQKFIDGTFREWVLRAVDGTVSLQAGQTDDSDGRKSIKFGVTDSAAAGTVTLKQMDADNPVTLGGGSGGTEDQPYLAYRRIGACALKAVNAWPIPYGTTALGRLTLVADRKGGGTEPLDFTVQFRFGDGAWQDLPADGDLSGESFTAGTSTLLWRLNDGAGIGLDNANDCRYVPSVYAVLLTYEQTSPDWLAEGYLKDVLTNIKAALNADGTLMGYEGWSGAQVGWADVMNLQQYHRCGCIVEWGETPEEHRGQKKEAGALVNMIDENHAVVVKACMRLDRKLEDMIIGDDQLLDFAEHVAQVLRSETLSDTVHSVTVSKKAPSTEYFESSEGEDEPGDILLIVNIDVEVHGEPFEAVRP